MNELPRITIDVNIYRTMLSTILAGFKHMIISQAAEVKVYTQCLTYDVENCTECNTDTSGKI